MSFVAYQLMIEFRQELPKNFVGKVLRRVLVEESTEP